MDDLTRIGTFSTVSDRQGADILRLTSVETVEPFPVPTLKPATTTEPVPTLALDSPTVTTQSSSKGVLDYLRDIGGNILGTLKTQATATVQGAIEGATASTAGAQAGAQVGASATGVSLPVLLAFGVVLLLLLRR